MLTHWSGYPGSEASASSWAPLAQCRSERLLTQVANNGPHASFDNQPSLMFVTTRGNVLQPPCAQGWVGTAKVYETLVPVEQVGVSRLAQFIPGEFGAGEGFWGLWIGNLFRAGGKGWKLAPPSFAHHRGQHRIAVVGKIQKRRRSTPFLALEKHRHER